MRFYHRYWTMLSKVKYDGEKPSTNKTTNTRMAGVAAGAPQGGDITVRYGGGIAPAFWADVVAVRACPEPVEGLDRAFKGEL